MSTSNTQHFDQTLKGYATLLARWKHASAVLWELTTSHKSLRVLLTKNQDGTNLLLACLDPIRLRAPIRWENSDLSFSRVEAEGQGRAFLIVDAGAEVEILCSGLELKENVKLF